MNDNAEQFVGALLGVLADEGHDGVRRELLDAYRSEADAARDELAGSLRSEVASAFGAHTDTRTGVNTVVTAVERLLERFSTVLEAVPVAVVVVDTAGRIESWNGGAERFFGWSEAQARHRPYVETLWAGDTDDEGGASPLARLREGDRLDGVETRYRHRNGSEVDVRVWAAPFHGADGGFEGATFVVSDITDRKQREQRLAVLNRVLRHDIRNDVAVVQGHLDMLADEVDGDDGHVRVIEDRLDGILELSEAARHIDRLRDADAGDLTTIELGRTLRERIDRLRREHPDAEIEATIPRSASAVAHELLPYALDNVLDNAIEHNTADTKRASVTVSETDGPNDDHVTVSVADNGPGLPPMERDVLTAETETPLNHSSGTGLWLARWIVGISDGTVTFEESEMGGTRVEVRLRT